MDARPRGRPAGAPKVKPAPLRRATAGKYRKPKPESGKAEAMWEDRADETPVAGASLEELERRLNNL